MLQALFGLPDIALRTMEVYTTGTLEAWLAAGAAAARSWRACMDRLAADARTAYRGVVYEHPQFVDYFHAATPEAGARAHEHRQPPGAPRRTAPASRRCARSRGSSRGRRRGCMLGAWLGVEEALERAIAARRARRSCGDVPRLAALPLGDRSDRDGAREGGRADRRPSTTAGCARRSAAARRRSARPARARHRAACSTSPATASCSSDNPVLRRSIDVRNPYVDPINLVQVELLRRLRGGEADERLRDAFVVTVNGIAAGMRNTG